MKIKYMIIFGLLLIFFLLIACSTATSIAPITPSSTPQANQTSTVPQITANVQTNVLPSQMPSQSATSTLAPTAGQGTLDGKSLVADRCTVCHSLSRVQRAHSAAEWQQIVGDMVGRGAQLNSAEQAAVIAYLSKTYGQ